MSKGEQAPSVGRVVHFVYGNQHIPAIITDPGFTGETRESDGSPGLLPPIPQALTVFPVGNPPFTTVATFDDTAASGTWHWPEYVPPKGEASS